MMIEVKSESIDVGDVNSLIRSYFLYFGYEETLQSFGRELGIPMEDATDLTFKNRKSILCDRLSFIFFQGFEQRSLKGIFRHL